MTCNQCHYKPRDAQCICRATAKVIPDYWWVGAGHECYFPTEREAALFAQLPEEWRTAITEAYTYEPKPHAMESELSASLRLTLWKALQLAVKDAVHSDQPALIEAECKRYLQAAAWTDASDSSTVSTESTPSTSQEEAQVNDGK